LFGFLVIDIGLISFRYEVKYDKDLDCGGAYIKLASKPLDGTPFDPKTFGSDTPYTIMFGPDKCGSAGTVLLIKESFPLKLRSNVVFVSQTASLHL